MSRTINSTGQPAATAALAHPQPTLTAAIPPGGEQLKGQGGISGRQLRRLVVGGLLQALTPQGKEGFPRPTAP